MIAPGLYEISNEQYHGGPGLSKSALDLLRRSPAHYAAAYIHGKREPSTPAQILGTRIHSSILEPHLFERDYVVEPAELSALSSATKAYKEGRKLFEEANPGRSVLSLDEWNTIRGMTDAVWSNPNAATLLQNGYAEQSVYWNHPDFPDVLCKARPDYLRMEGVVIDVKTTKDAGAKAFASSIANFRYHVQAAWYLHGLSFAFGREFKHFVFIAVEKEPPYGVAIYEASPDMVFKGEMDYREDFARYIECSRSGVWPGYDQSIKMIDLPRWALG